MKPEYPVNGDNTAVVSNELSSEKKEERSLINDSKIKEEELCGFSSEFLSKINSFFEIHNSFLYDDVHENERSLENYLSMGFTSEETNKMNGDCFNESEILDDEKSYSFDSQKLYSSRKRYNFRNNKKSLDLPYENGNVNVKNANKCLKNEYSVEIEKKTNIPDSFQLPVSNEAQNTVTFDAPIFENSMIDIKLQAHNSPKILAHNSPKLSVHSSSKLSPHHSPKLPARNLSNLLAHNSSKLQTLNLSSSSQDLTAEQKSIRLNKKSSLKKNIKKKSSDKLVIPCKIKECSSTKELFSRDVLEKPELEGTTSVLGNLKCNSSNVIFGVTEKKNQEKYLRVSLADIVKNSQGSKKQLQDKNDVLFFERALSKLKDELNKPEIKTITEKKCESIFENAPNESSGEKYSKRNRVPSSSIINNLNNVNDSEKRKKETFNTDIQNTFLDKPNTTEVEENLYEKSNTRENDLLDKISVSELSQKKKSTSRKKTIKQNNTIKVKFGKRSRSKKNAILENEDIFNENIMAENEDLFANEFENDFNKEDFVNVDDTKQKVRSKLFKCKTSTPASQITSAKISDCLNKSVGNSVLTEVPPKNSNSFLQLFNKVIESSSSETFSQSNHSIAKLFEQRKSSRLGSLCKSGKDLDKKLTEEKYLQPNSHKNNSICFADLKPFKTVEEILGKDKKQCIEDNAAVISSPKKKKQEPVKKNCNKKCKDEISSKEAFDEHYNAKTTKVAEKQPTNDTAISSSPCKRIKRNKKSSKKINEKTFKMSSSSKDVSVDLHKKSKTVIKSVKNATISISNLSADSCTSRKRSRKKKSDITDFIDAKSPHMKKRKADSSASTELEAIYTDEKLDACSFIKVTDVKSLANVNKKKNQSLKKRKSNSLIPASFSKDSKAVKNSKKQLSLFNSEKISKRKNKSSQFSDISPYKNLNINEYESQHIYENTSSYNSSEVNSETVRGKRNRKSTTVDPNFYYEVKNSRTKKDVKSLSSRRKSMQLHVLKKSPRRRSKKCKVTDVNNELSDSDSVSESTNEHDMQSCNNEGDFVHQNSNTVPINSSNLFQYQGTTYSLFPINTQCKILYNHDINCSMLAVPIASAENLPALTPNMIANDKISQAPMLFQTQNFQVSKFIASPQYITPVISSHNPPVTQQQTSQRAVNSHYVSSVVPGQTIPPVFATQNISPIFASQTVPSVVATPNSPSLSTHQNVLPQVKPQTFSCVVNSESAPASSSEVISDNSLSLQSSNIQSNNSDNGFTGGLPRPNSRIVYFKRNTFKSIQNTQTCQMQRPLPNPALESILDWPSFVQNATKIDLTQFHKIFEAYNGRKFCNYTVREFCSNPDIVQVLSTTLKDTIPELQPRIEYKLHSSVIDEPLIHVLKDFVQFYMKHVFAKIQDKSGEALRVLLFKEVYSKFTLRISSLFSEIMPRHVTDLDVEHVTAFFCLIGIVYIFHEFYK